MLIQLTHKSIDPPLDGVPFYVNPIHIVQVWPGPQTLGGSYVTLTGDSDPIWVTESAMAVQNIVRAAEDQQ